jgi:hypothetical protein
MLKTPESSCAAGAKESSKGAIAREVTGRLVKDAFSESSRGSPISSKTNGHLLKNTERSESA